MLRRLIQWLKGLISRWFGGQRTHSHMEDDLVTRLAPPLTDSDLEFLFNELIEGVHQARGKDWAQKWLDNIEHRVSTEDWIQWLRRFGERLLASPTPNNELAARLVQLGELGVGEVGKVAYEVGMQLLTRLSREPIWEYDGPDALNTTVPTKGVTQTVTLDQLLVMLQQDQNLRQQIAQQLAIETDDPQLIVQELVNQHYAASKSNTDRS